MKRWCSMAAVSVALTMALAGCQPKGETAAAPPAAPQAVALANTTCPVMKGRAINPALTVDYKGKTYGMCCGICVSKFKADPEKYLAAANTDAK